MTNAEARFSKSLRPRKPEGSLGRTAQDVHLDSHTAPELCLPLFKEEVFEYSPLLFLFFILYFVVVEKTAVCTNRKAFCFRVLFAVNRNSGHIWVNKV